VRTLFQGRHLAPLEREPRAGGPDVPEPGHAPQLVGQLGGQETAVGCPSSMARLYEASSDSGTVTSRITPRLAPSN
jgi:hypothetical protein